MTYPWPTLMPMGIVVISCVRPSVQPSMGLGLCIAYKALGRNVLQFGMLMYPDGLHSAFNTLVDTGDICCHYWQHILVFLLICAVFVSNLVLPFVNLSETIAGYRSNRSPLLIMLTEPMFCRNSSINISIDNRYDNRFILLGRPIFTVNHNDACVYNSDCTWERACACYTREAPLTQSGNWV